MIYYYCGDPKCGKSERVEEELRKIRGRVLYVGTLPVIQLYQGTILRHKLRRPAFWDLYDCTGDPLQDIAYLKARVSLFDGVLIDGLAYYIQRALYYYPPDANWLIAFRGFLDQVSSLPLHLFLVDQPVGLAPPMIRKICGLAHEELYDYCEKLYYVVDGTVDEVKKDYLRKKDGMNDD